MKFPSFKQYDNKDCGPTCLRIVCKYYGVDYSLAFIRNKTFINKTGVSFLGLQQAAKSLYFDSMAIFIDYSTLLEVDLPCIVHWNENHFVVVYKITKNHVYISDPVGMRLKFTKETFQSHWIGKERGNNKGSVLLLYPTETFYEKKEENSEKKMEFKHIFVYLKSFKISSSLLLIGLLGGTFIQFVLPFLTQMVIDFGISKKDISVLKIILFSQLGLLLSKIVFDFCRDYLLINISVGLNMQIVYDFLLKLLHLPISFFDNKMSGDILRRIEDNGRIEKLLSNSSLNFIFSLFTFLTFGIILGFYNINILLVYIGFTIIYILYISRFLKYRRDYDIKKFYETIKSQNLIIQIIDGIIEVKLNNSENNKLSEWNSNQSLLKKIRIASAKLSLTQETGSMLINELRNYIILYFSARLVINNIITLGALLSIQYMIGFLNQAVSLSLSFVRELQDAKISFERILELQNIPNENELYNLESCDKDFQDIDIKQLKFRYEGPESPLALNNINLYVPHGNVTAIVGSSGSGKTTLLKVLLKFYDSFDGQIFYGDHNINQISPYEWRRKCGVVMQDGFIFSDTIARNVALCAQTSINDEDMEKAFKIANINDYVNSLPQKENSIIGQEGLGLSQGQKQRLLIARAVYKNPEIIFFDEATSALDANNEKIIMDNLQKFFKHRTVFIIAHRLSTVKNADKILVMDNGCIVEEGTHAQLLSNKSYYYKLIINQLEIAD